MASTRHYPQGKYNPRTGTRHRPTFYPQQARFRTWVAMLFSTYPSPAAKTQEAATFDFIHAHFSDELLAIVRDHLEPLGLPLSADEYKRTLSPSVFQILVRERASYVASVRARRNELLRSDDVRAQELKQLRSPK